MNITHLRVALQPASARSSSVQRHHAFTLLELVIVLAIVAVLAAYAWPSYRSQIARGHRTDAVAALYRAAQYVESATREGSAQDSIARLPAGYDQAPASGGAVYRLTVLAADDANGGYTIEALPVEDGPMRSDSCGIFTLDGVGVRGNRKSTAESAASTDTASCWNSG